MGKVIYLVPLSGGLDSTFLVYYLLEKGYNVHSFHLSIIHNKENRWREEINAVKNIEHFFKNNYNKFSLDYCSMEFNELGLGFDTDQVLLMAQKMCYRILRDHDVKNILLCHGIVKDDINNFINKRMNFKGKGINHLLWNALIDSLTYKISPSNIGKICRYIQLPLLDNNLDKKTIVNLIPQELFGMVWVCRTNIDGKPCGICKSCKLHNKALDQKV